MSQSEFHLQPSDVKAIAIALDELTSYLGATEGLDAADDEKLRWTEKRLTGLLDRYARFESFSAAATKAFQVVQAEPIRVTVRATPPSGPLPSRPATSPNAGNAGDESNEGAAGLPVKEGDDRP